jgi:hypothetical protein
MTKQNSSKLVELYPEMFSWSYKAQPQTKLEVMLNNVLSFLHKHLKFTRKIKYIKQTNPYNYQFEVGDGWYSILYELILKIKFNDQSNGNWVTKVTQLKEKFGGLRFYVTGTSKNNWELIREAENKSHTICEVSGSTENVGIWKYGWVLTLSRKEALAKYAKLVDEGKDVKFDECWSLREDFLKERESTLNKPKTKSNPKQMNGITNDAPFVKTRKKTKK